VVRIAQLRATVDTGVGNKWPPASGYNDMVEGRKLHTLNWGSTCRKVENHCIKHYQSFRKKWDCIKCRKLSFRTFETLTACERGLWLSSQILDITRNAMRVNQDHIGSEFIPLPSKNQVNWHLEFHHKPQQHHLLLVMANYSRHFQLPLHTIVIFDSKVLENPHRLKLYLLYRSTVLGWRVWSKLSEANSMAFVGL